MPRRPPPDTPPERTATPRRTLRDCLDAVPRTARELSAAACLSERDVLAHLAHLQRSLARQGARLDVVPAECLACGFLFRKRERLERPGRCPRCHSTHLQPPRFFVTPS